MLMEPFGYHMLKTNEMQKYPNAKSCLFSSSIQVLTYSSSEEQE